MLTSTQNTLEALLRENFSPLKLEVSDDSVQHAGHSGARPEGSTHFSVLIVSREFSGKSLMDRHRMVYRALRTTMEKEGIHALAMKTLSPEELPHS